MKKQTKIGLREPFCSKNQKGITLVALVITIIILLILAGISISTLVGENGLFEKAKYARFINEYETVNEKIRLYMLENKIDEIQDITKEEKYPIVGERITQIGDSLKETIESVNNTELSIENLNLFQVDFDKLEINLKEKYVIDIDTKIIYLFEGRKIGNKIYHIPYFSSKLNNDIEINVNKYTISFNADGGVCDIQSKEIEENNIYGTLPKPLKEGYNFLGWYTQQENGIEVKETDIVTDNIILYARWAVKSNLVAWYDGINNTSQGHDYYTKTWTDLTGNKTKAATLNGGTWINNGLYFNGESDYVNMNNILIPKQGDFALEIVMELQKYPTEYAFLLGQNAYDTIVSGRFGFLYSKEDETLAVKFGEDQINGVNNLGLKEKTTVTIVKNESKIQLWINGIKVNEEDWTNIDIYQTNTILGRWGDWGDDGRYFCGIIYSIKMYDGILIGDEIKNNYNQNIERFKDEEILGIKYKDYSKDGLEAWYDGIENVSENNYDYNAKTWTDLTGNNTTGAKISGAKWMYKGLLFDGSNDYVNLNQKLMPEKNEFTIEIVTEMRKYPSEYGFIIGQNNSTATASNRTGVFYSKEDNMLVVQNRRN